MSIYKYKNTGWDDLSPGLQDVLRRNGIQAHMSLDNQGNIILTVLGHDSPMIQYKISEKQAENLMYWGSNSANKKAYSTFTDIVRQDFTLPDSFVSAQNAFGRVQLGQHGYRLGNREYGRPFYRPFSINHRGWGGNFLGWHVRRRNGMPAVLGGRTPIVPYRPDGRLKPGELQSGGYGFYYKGQQKRTEQHVLDNVLEKDILKPLEGKPRPEGEAKIYSQEIASDYYFTAEKFLEVMASHGIIIDKERKTMSVQSSKTRVDLEYDLTEGELKTLTAQKVKGNNDAASLKKRLDVINKILSLDFKDTVTKEMMETKNLINIELKEEVKQDVEAKFILREKEIQHQQEERREYQALKKELADETLAIAQNDAAVNGKDIQKLLGEKGWFRPDENGREVVVGEIKVEGTTDGKYKMTAVINGERVSHEISQKQYDKFLALDESHRMKMFDKFFTEVKIKGAERKITPEIIRDGRGHYTRRDRMEEAAASSKATNSKKWMNAHADKGFYRELKGGKEVEVEKIEVSSTQQGKYKMTAVINGERVSHEINQKQYDKFLAVNDDQRVRMFANIFPEVAIKNRPGEGFHLGAAIRAALTVGSDLLLNPFGPFPRYAPELYVETNTDRRVDERRVSARDLAAANYEDANRKTEESIRRAHEMTI